MQMKNRSRSDIVSQILETANGGTSKTKIMYGAFLSYAQLKDYLAVLLENGLLKYEDAKMQYRTTPKGFDFLKAYGRLDKMFEIEQQ